MQDPTKCFRVTTIRLGSSSFETAEDISESLIDDRCTAQTRRWTTHKFLERSDDSASTKVLLATVRLGFRLIRPEETGDAPEKTGDAPEKVFYSLEASFVAEFDVISGDYDEASLADFVKMNVAHIVWPFWRQHVYSTLQAACLPAIKIPLMAGVKRSGAAVANARLVAEEPND